MRYTRKSSVTSLPSRQVAFCPICTNLTCSLCLLCLSSAAVCGISRGLVMEMVFKNVFLLSDRIVSSKLNLPLGRNTDAMLPSVQHF